MAEEEEAKVAAGHSNACLSAPHRLINTAGTVAMGKEVAEGGTESRNAAVAATSSSSVRVSITLCAAANCELVAYKTRAIIKLFLLCSYDGRPTSQSRPDPAMPCPGR